MPDNLLPQPPEENPETAYADKWLQRILTYTGLPSGVLFLILHQTYLAIFCFLWLAVAIGYSFVKFLRNANNLELGLKTFNGLSLPIQTPSPNEIGKQEEIVAIPLSERPNILTTLVFDSVKSQKVDFHIEIENIGKVQARNIRIGFNTDEFFDIEITPYISRTLFPGGKLSITKPIPRVLKPNKTTSLIVKIFYNAEISGIEKMLLQKVRFLVRPSDIKIQTIFPEASEETEVDSGLSEPDLTPALIQFSQSLGTLCMVLPEVGKNGNPNMLFLGNEFRSFNFDSIARIVSLRAKTISGGLVSLDLPLLPSKNGIHIIIITWDYAKGATLGIDGKEEKDMRENPK